MNRKIQNNTSDLRRIARGRTTGRWRLRRVNQAIMIPDHIRIQNLEKEKLPGMAYTRYIRCFPWMPVWKVLDTELDLLSF